MENNALAVRQPLTGSVLGQDQQSPPAGLFKEGLRSPFFVRPPAPAQARLPHS